MYLNGEYTNPLYLPFSLTVTVDTRKVKGKLVIYFQHI